MEKVAIVGIQNKKNQPETLFSLQELTRLVETAGGQVSHRFIQTRPRKDPATLIGRGKVKEISQQAERGKIDTVIFDEELSPAQQRELQESIKAKVLDRTRVILDIFAQRARTHEGKLQVELAQLNYLLPRATEKFGRFEQQVGGIGTRGPGERKLEVDQRHIRARILRIKKQIEHVRQHRRLQRQNRRRVPLPIVALIGYTNVGKSTLLNTLTQAGGEGVYADDKLFATLDPTTRQVKLPGGRLALFVDTVGFIQKLPHHLVAALRATLEEVTNAHLLIHVVDAAHSQWKRDFKIVQNVLNELKADKLPQLVVLNKSDRLTEQQRILFERRDRPLISGLTGRGLRGMLGRIETLLDAQLIEKSFILPFGQRQLLPIFYRAGRVLSEKTVPTGTKLTVKIDPQNWGHIQNQLKGARTI